MSGFDLVRVDGGGRGDPIHLPPGETVLGRGPLLAVSDKRVSRLHGLLENLNGQLRLKPTHLNPCFVQSSLTDSPRPLQRDSWYPLRDGDLFSLLPGHFIYKVVAVGGEDRTPRNSQLFEEEEELPVSPEPDVGPPPPVGPTPPRNEPAPAALSDQEEADNGRLNKADCAQPTEEEDDRKHVTPPVTKRRVLPAWMMAAVADTHSPSSSSSSPKVPTAAKRSKAPSTSAKGAAAKQATPPKTSSPEGAGLSEEEEEEVRPKKRRRKRSDEEQTTSRLKTDLPPQQPSVRLPSESKRSEMSDESDAFPMETDEAEGGGETSTADRNVAKNGQRLTKRAESLAANSGAASGPRLRTPCPYGKSCYRKNPVHFQECSHPGDTDYEEDEEEEEETVEADRPECPYGTDCYRKNPLHRKEYKHTKKPARATRAVPKKDDGDEDDGDDDSFINDDSDDAGDDSDYLPPVSDDSDKEDVKALQKEAKAFMKRKK
ncbi:aprataxin and PNK-like factor [Sander lucioperca]|uniref:aprataxin and PNK-like factor n=1 Tax=Sander lucioperca TaxID=283035 RepID=UPI001653C989|nr:aprataxin and PNK-like factor [Sander lucioperca]XP_035855862.1 aprataxin and PNK-like factor [Sander lucioperca]XP_035855863.1 aprataxin and PNK-like factor [Sander lucioperca]XP_035855864.1 aprataxin and PNK-like factor [Sander lucioperca]